MKFKNFSKTVKEEEEVAADESESQRRSLDGRSENSGLILTARFGGNRLLAPLLLFLWRD